MPLQPGELVHGKYRIVRLIGDGGMGSIYEARHEVLGTLVALKFLHPELSRRQGLVMRFMQEARVSATLRSPHIVQVLDVEPIEGGAFLVMELLQGETLQAMLERDHRLSRELSIDLALQMLAGLDIAHASGVVHRDLKPDNVFIVSTQYGPMVKLLDFGIAKLRVAPELQQRALTRPGVTMGTPEYMAPEQACSADTVDLRADIYAMGVMLFEMLSGYRPVANPSDDPRDIAQQVIAGKIRSLRDIDPTIHPDLAALIHRAMSPAISSRFGSSSEMQRALLPFAGELSAAGRQIVAVLTGTMPAWKPTPAPPATNNPGVTSGVQVSSAGSLAARPTDPRLSAQQPAPVAAPSHLSLSAPLPATAPSPGNQAHLVSSGASLDVSPRTPPMDDRPGVAGQPQGDAHMRRPSAVPKTLPPEDEPPQRNTPDMPMNAGLMGPTAARDPLPAAFAPQPSRAPMPTPVDAQYTQAQAPYQAQGFQQPYQPQGTAVAQVPMMPPGYGMPQAPVVEQPPIAAPAYVPHAPKKKSSKNLWIMGVVALLGGAGITLALMMPGSSGGSGSGTSTPPTSSVPAMPVADAGSPPPTSTPSPTTPGTTPTAPTPSNTGTSGPKPLPRDGGVGDAGQDGGGIFPGIFDGGIPTAIPTSIPTNIPTTIPTSIPIPIPGFP
ncbi:MAG: protein kinase [Polyangiaceae bacterium]